MTTRLTIRGMTCLHCAQTLERALAGVEGVEAVRVSYPKREALVQGRAQAEALTHAVEQSGYGVERSRDEAPEREAGDA